MFWNIMLTFTAYGLGAQFGDWAFSKITGYPRMYKTWRETFSE